MIETVLLFILSLLFITKGADWFTESAISISTKSGLPKVLIGATIVSFATTAPEFAVSATAAFIGHTDLTVGNAVGSAICNIGLALGLVILMKAIPVEGRGFLIKGGFMLFAGLLLIGLTLDRVLSPFDGILLLVVFIAFMYYNYRSQKALFDGRGQRERMSFQDIRRDLMFFVIGAGLVIAGSRVLVDTGTKIAIWLGIPEMIIGLTLIALGTSLPELITAISATLKGHQDLSVGNILGANTMDIAMILGFSSQITSLPILEQSIYYDFPVMILIMGMLVVFGFTKKCLEKWEGALILATYVIYVAGLLMFYS